MEGRNEANTMNVDREKIKKWLSNNMIKKRELEAEYLKIMGIAMNYGIDTDELEDEIMKVYIIEPKILKDGRVIKDDNKGHFIVEWNMDQ